VLGALLMREFPHPSGAVEVHKYSITAAVGEGLAIVRARRCCVSSAC
jgi:hypothetical protein